MGDAVIGPIKLCLWSSGSSLMAFSILGNVVRALSPGSLTSPLHLRLFVVINGRDSFIQRSIEVRASQREKSRLLGDALPA
jgi:hypothetical protein